MPLSRRRFLLRSAAGVSASALAAWSTGCATRSSSPAQAHILDTHTHFYDPTRPGGVPWPSPNDTELFRPVLPPEFIQLTQPLGVRGTVVVEASPWESDNAWVLQLAESHPIILGLVGHLKPGSPQFATELQRYALNRRFRGIRTGGWNVNIDPTQKQFLQDLALLADRRLTLDVNVGQEHLLHIALIARELPHLTIILNHVANVRIDSKSPPTPWLKGMEACAAHPNICCKLSGLVEGSGLRHAAPSDTHFYQHILESVWSFFGDQRLVFGSNWPVSALFAPYHTVLQIVQDFVASHSPHSAPAVFHHNARRLYGVKS